MAAIHIDIGAKANWHRALGKQAFIITLGSYTPSIL